MPSRNAKNGVWYGPVASTGTSDFHTFNACASHIQRVRKFRLRFWQCSRTLWWEFNSIAGGWSSKFPDARDPSARPLQRINGICTPQSGAAASHLRKGRPVKSFTLPVIVAGAFASAAFGLAGSAGAAPLGAPDASPDGRPTAGQRVRCDREQGRHRSADTAADVSVCRLVFVG
jgi:hypothetical protein